MEQEAEPKVEIPNVLSFRKKMKRLSPHRLPMKEQIKNQTISYVDLFYLDPLLARLEENRVPQVHRRLESWRMKSKDDKATLEE